jgi:hypothetical protein
VAINPILNWSQSFGSSITYKVYVGTNYPPSNMLNGSVTSQQIYALSNLAYNTTYYWKIVPHDQFQDATDCPVWSFTTTDEIVLAPPAVNTGSGFITTGVTIPAVTGNVSANVNVSWNTNVPVFNAPGLDFVLNSPAGGISFSGRDITIEHNLGFIPEHVVYRILPSFNWKMVAADASWNTSEITLHLAPVKADGDLEVIFPGILGTLPVELSSFTVSLTASYFVSLAWTTQSETNHLGYNLYRNTSADYANAVQINNQLISSGTTNGSVTNYRFTDREVENATTYYYWLVSVDLDGASTLFGPIHLLVQNPENPNNPPETVIPTHLKEAFPNPFNPQTTISYYLQDAADVQIEIYNVQGQKLHVFQNHHNQAGSYQVHWDGKDLNGKKVGSGVYYYKMKAGSYTCTKKMSLLK